MLFYNCTDESPYDHMRVNIEDLQTGQWCVCRHSRVGDSFMRVHFVHRPNFQLLSIVINFSLPTHFQILSIPIQFLHSNGMFPFSVNIISCKLYRTTNTALNLFVPAWNTTRLLLVGGSLRKYPGSLYWLNHRESHAPENWMKMM